MLWAAAKNEVTECTAMQAESGLYHLACAGEAEKAEQKPYLMIYTFFLDDMINAALQAPNRGGIPRILWIGLSVYFVH